MESISAQLTVSAIIVWLIEKLKSAPWFPALTPESTERVKRVVGAIVAGLAAVGVTYTYDPLAGVLTVKGLTLASMFSFGWNWLQNFIFQQGIYHGIMKPANGKQDGGKP